MIVAKTPFFQGKIQINAYHTPHPAMILILLVEKSNNISFTDETRTTTRLEIISRFIHNYESKSMS